MDVTIKKNTDESADLELPNGCVLCGGPVSVRVSPNAAYSVCIPCRWWVRASVAFRPGGIEVMYTTTAAA
jgi:hypothetical protein